MASRKVIFSIVALSAGTLLLESTLTRLLAVAQFYHFSFLVVSLALLGFGASGTLLSVVPRLRKLSITRLFSLLGLGFVFSVGLVFAVVNLLPFDSYSIAWDRRQFLLFALYYLALTIPFIISGLGIGAALAASARENHRIYSANLIGSGLGAFLGPAVLWMAGVPGAVLMSGILGLLASLAALQNDRIKPWVVVAVSGCIVTLGGLTVMNFQARLPLGITISPYKGLAQAKRVPDSKIVFSRWNATSYLAVLSNTGVHQLPGLSYLYSGLLPHQDGISVDADALQAITLAPPKDFVAAKYLPESLAFELVPQANVLILEPGGGLGILQALAGNASQVTTVVENELTPRAIAQSTPAFDVYAYSRVALIQEPVRGFLQKTNTTFDVIYLPLTDAYRPVASGSYSLVEDYSLTVEAFEAILKRLDPQGIFIFSRWIQMPPSESLRAFGTLLEALERSTGLHPNETLVIYRGIQTMTVLARPDGWTREMLTAVREFTTERKFDLVWLPDIEEGEVNRFNQLAEPIYYQNVRDLLSAEDRVSFFSQYSYDITPPTDDQPFFFHFFKWEQVPEVWATLGHTWQPFGGSGYLVLLVLLVLTALLSVLLILLPLQSINQNLNKKNKAKWFILLYFGFIGIAFLFVEIPLIQKWILFLGHPTYAFTAVVATLLIFSGLGSNFSRVKGLPRRTALISLPLLALLTFIGLSHFSNIILSWPTWVRIVVTVIILAPLGFWMGLPFPFGLSWLQSQAPGWISWAWAVNGCTSVISSVLAAILSLSMGFSSVLILGVGAYAVAAGIYVLMLKFSAPQ